MRDDYKMNGPLTRLEVQVEKDVIEKLSLMEKHARIPVAELVNTAIKRFISHHKDYLPPRPG